MDPESYINQRKGRVMAQTLEAFEVNLEPLLPSEIAESFKALVRKKLNGFASDMVALVTNPNMALNGHAQATKDSLFPHGKPQRSE